MEEDNSRETIPTTGMTKFKGIKRKRYEETEGEEKPMTCSICLEDLTADTEYSSLLCSHVFHSNCVDQWLNRKRSCPNCRNVVESEGPDQSNIPQGVLIQIPDREFFVTFEELESDDSTNIITMERVSLIFRSTLDLLGEDY